MAVLAVSSARRLCAAPSSCRGDGLRNPPAAHGVHCPAMCICSRLPERPTPSSSSLGGTVAGSRCPQSAAAREGPRPAATSARWRSEPPDTSEWSSVTRADVAPTARSSSRGSFPGCTNSPSPGHRRPSFWPRSIAPWRQSFRPTASSPPPLSSSTCEGGYSPSRTLRTCRPSSAGPGITTSRSWAARPECLSASKRTRRTSTSATSSIRAT